MAARKPKVVWSRLADLDLDSAHSYLQERSPESASQFATSILDAIEQLRRHPQCGPVATDILPEGRYRHLPVGRYRIIYRVVDGAVVLLRIWGHATGPR